MKKVNWVTDYIHGSMTMSALDMGLVSTELYNRLHNVLQNSTLYFTFPSNRTSRFAHSLGCAHLAGKIFQSSISNASEECLKKFFADFRTHLGAIDKSGEQETKVIPERIQALRNEDWSNFSDKFYCSIVPVSLSREDQYLYLLLYQAVRFAGLLHDIGHPPFSHVVENGLVEIRDWLKDKKANQDLQPELEILLEQMEKGGAVFHEGLGHKLAASALDDLVGRIPKSNSKFWFDVIRIKHLTMAILECKERDIDFFKSIGMIISGVFDADRLDYVSRDSVMCGLRKASMETSRFTESFHLTKNASSPEAFVFAPSTRALSTIEEFLRRRFVIYKYAICHHRVVKFDRLLQACVVDLAIDWLSDVEKLKKKEDDCGLLNHDISGLWQVLQGPNLDRTIERTESFIQWDDAWLLSILRQSYFKHAARTDRSKADNLFFKLEELLSNKKWYYSVIKRVDAFAEIEKAFLNDIPSDFNWADLGLKADITESLKREFLTAKTHSATSTEPLNGFFIDRLFEAFEACGQPGDVKKMLEKACVAINAAPVSEVFFELKKIKAGVKAESLLANSNGASVRISQVSRIVAELKEAGRFFPPFFVFVRPSSEKEGGFSGDELAAMRQTIGSNMARNMLEYSKKGVTS